MNYWKFHFETTAESKDILLAFLSELPFEVFEETDSGLEAWAPESAAGIELDNAVSQLHEQVGFRFEKAFIPSQNWNAVWESNFQPVVVDDFCGVRAEFHEPLQGVQYELVIQPRMAFGTGHHATTEMMIRAMKDIRFSGAKVLDFGCGTGILAILAAKMGATHIDAVDIEEESYANTIQNAALNGAAHVQAFCGTLYAVPPDRYDVVLANINRNVLLDTMEAMEARLAPRGVLLISGILTEDVSVLTRAAAACGLAPSRQLQKGDWACMELQRAG